MGSLMKRPLVSALFAVAFLLMLAGLVMLTFRPGTAASEPVPETVTVVSVVTVSTTAGPAPQYPFGEATR
ncbi:hypothetical protein IU453_27650 [Nocardia cyriacigeorgica]|uniref:hypothetical protein n=1 Tax=Nocardia cyriacigeorgica TaxID=135487 RepID=UPI00189447B9|nr:hypothetical protein [Nocardia cyriacigeorgica]MBF6320524.1 hypothetical protein [Nocardia cyriacigeorgica]MBF6535011.1 hypothetical protein [Nocardia cyriacigeorgica]